MNASVSIEKILNNVSDNHDLVYPVLSEEIIFYMSMEALKNTNRTLCFPYFRNVEQRDYVDIYVFDAGRMDTEYKRFIIEKGYALEEKEERLFLEYLCKDIWVEDFLYTGLVEAIRDKYPEIHLEFYGDWRHSLLHVYFTWFRSGAYELLFKANLNFLATALMGMGEYDMLGSSPEKIFDVPMGMLKILNSPFGAEILPDPEERQWAKYLYAKHHNLIRSRGLNKYQWRYLKEQEERGEEIEQRLFKFLGKLCNDENYYTYLRYAEQKQVVDAYYSLPQYPSAPDLEEQSEICDMIEWYIENEWRIDGHLREKVKKHQSDYAYETEKYMIFMPTSLCEILDEAQSQHNCLARYVFRAAYYNTIILFMREKAHETESFITIEVEDGVIRQALKAYNATPNKMEQQFLAEYAKTKKLSLGYGCFDDEDGDDDDWDEED